METILNVQVSEQEYSTMKAFADFQGQTITSLVLNAIRDIMDEWEDVRDAEEALALNELAVPWEEVKRMSKQQCTE